MRCTASSSSMEEEAEEEEGEEEEDEEEPVVFLILLKRGQQPLWRPDCLSAGAPVPSLAGWTSGLFRFFRFFNFFRFSHFHLLWNQIKKYDMFR